MFLAALPTFQRLFPGFPEQCKTLYTILLPVAIVLLATGLIGVVRQASSPRSMVRPIITILMIVMAIALWLDLANTANDAMKTVIAQMNANPAQAAQKYTDILVSKESSQEKGGWFGLPSAAQMYEAVLWGVLSLIGIVAQFIIWAAYIVQQFLLGLSYAFAPLFLGFLALRSTSQIGVRYIMGMVGIISWPLGWAAASIGTSNLIDVATEQGLVVATNVYGLQTILAAALIGGWIIITTLIAPVIIQAAIASGAQVGGALLAGALTSGAAAASTGVSTAAALAASRGTGTAGSLAGASGAAIGSLLGSAMQGGGPPISGSLLSRLAPPSSRSNGSSSNGSGGGTPSGQGSSGTRAPSSGGGAAPRQNFNPNDAANDGAVEEMVARSKRADGGEQVS